MGTLVALLASQAIGTIVLIAILAAMRPHLLALPRAAVLGLAGAGFLSLIGWLTYYRALEYGPVGIVSGTAATYGGVTALLAMLVARRAARRVRGLGVRSPSRAWPQRLAGHHGPGRRRLAAGLRRPVGRRERGRAPLLPGMAGRADRARRRRRPWPGLLLALASAATYGTGAFWWACTPRPRDGWCLR